MVKPLKLSLRFLRIRQLLRLPSAVSLDVLYKASLRITLAIPEVVDTENRVSSLFYHSCLTRATLHRCSHSDS